MTWPRLHFIRISSELTFATSLVPAFQNESVKGELDPVYSEFLKGNAPELDVNNIKVKDPYSNEIKTVANAIEPLKNDIVQSTDEVYSPHQKPFAERMPAEKMDQLMKKIPDVITINDRPLSEIVDEKYEDQELIAEQRQTARNCDTYITEKNATGKYRSSDKGNDRLMCATGFLTSLDGDLAEKKLADVNLKNLRGEKAVRENVNENGKVKVSLKALMEEGNESRKNVKKEADNAARQDKKRMHERTAKSNNAPGL
ncbi:MAG: hypothetical protein K6F90_01745 [Lachnospiraceae bacterium]|nr:hypothetical protein [Lachnospiraceae bacterium]